MEAEKWLQNEKLVQRGQGKRNEGEVKDGCKRWINRRGNVTVEELESSLNLFCILLSENMRPPVIGFKFTRHSCFFSPHARWLWNGLLLVCMSAGLNLNVSFSLRMQMRQDRTCVSCLCCIRMPYKPVRYLLSSINREGCIATGNQQPFIPLHDGSVAQCPCVGGTGLIGCDDSYALNCVSYSPSVALFECSQALDVSPPGVSFLSTYWSF